MSAVPFFPETLCTGLVAIAARSLFCTWRLVSDPANPEKPKKIPYIRGGNRLTGAFDDPALPSKLMPLAEAIHAATNHMHDGVGLVFTPGCNVIGLDVDHSVVGGRFTGTTEQQQAFKGFEPYAFIEISQSGTGLHAIALGDAVTNKMNGVLEVFGNKNFLALTGVNGHGVATVLPRSALDVANELICRLQGNIKRKTSMDPHLNSDLTAHLKGAEGQESLDVVRTALRYLDPGMSRDQWRTLVWAIRHGLGDTPEALELADQWSCGALHSASVTPSNYSSRADVEQVWNSYNPSHSDRVTVGSLYKMASDKGWSNLHKTASGAHQNRTQGASGAQTKSEWSGAFKLTDGDVQISQTPPAKRSYVFADTVTAGTYNVLAGSGGTLKTMLMMISAASMAVGQDFGDVRIAQGAAMLFLGEEDHPEISRRLSAASTHYGFDPAVVSRLVKAFPAAGVDLRLTREMNGSIDASALVQNVISLAEQHAQACGGPVRLIVFDHARLVMEGDPDDAANVTQLTRVLTQIAQATGAAVFLLAHSPKTVLRQQAKEMSIADVAGSSAFSDNARTGFIMYGMREDDAKTLQIPDAERKKYVKLECAKANYGPQGTEWWFEKVTLDDWQTAVLKPVSLIRPMFGPGQAKQQLRQRILDLLTSAPLSARAIRDRAGQRRQLGASEKEALAAVDALLEDGRIERRKPM
ncbi:MAG: AAA family ATPase, partial [Betaproteobacteria bacterium]